MLTESSSGSSTSTVRSLRPRRDRPVASANSLPLVLLRDLQHRVANVLYFASLQLEVQARRTADGASKAAFQDIATSFRQLIEAQKRFVITDFEAVADGGAEVEEACTALTQAYAAARPGVRFDCLVDDALRCAVRPAGVLSLIVNELVTNAYKHAFRGREAGYLLVSLAPAGNGRVRLSVIDDGPGFAIPVSAQGSGLGIVEALAAAIDGEVCVSGGGGAGGSVRVTFSPLPR